MGYPKKTIGHRFLCIRNIITKYGSIGYCRYKTGRIYKSEVEGCITDEFGDKNQEWIEYPGDTDWKDVFRLIGNKRRSGPSKR